MDLFAWLEMFMHFIGRGCNGVPGEHKVLQEHY